MTPPRIVNWLRCRLRKAYPPKSFPGHEDDLSNMQKEAIERNQVATMASIEASNQATNKASEAVRRALKLMEANRNERH
jgi:hypothetical protein